MMVLLLVCSIQPCEVLRSIEITQRDCVQLCYQWMKNGETANIWTVFFVCVAEQEVKERYCVHVCARAWVCVWSWSMAAIRRVHQWEELKSQTVLSPTGHSAQQAEQQRRGRYRKFSVWDRKWRQTIEGMNTMSWTPTELMISAIIAVFNLNCWMPCDAVPGTWRDDSLIVAEQLMC